MIKLGCSFINCKTITSIESDFKRTVNYNKYQSKLTIQRQSQYLDYLIDPSFQGVNRIYVSSFEYNPRQTSCNQYFLLTVETKDYNVMIDGQKVFDQPVNNNLRIYDNAKKITTHQRDDYTIGCLLDYPSLKTYY